MFESRCKFELPDNIIKEALGQLLHTSRTQAKVQFLIFIVFVDIKLKVCLLICLKIAIESRGKKENKMVFYTDKLTVEENM